MAALGLILFLLLGFPALAQTTCAPTPAYSPCDITFDLSDAEAAQHPNPYLTVQLQAEFRSPRHRTFLMPAFWDGGKRLVIRFAPTEAGDWDFRLTSNVARFDGKLGKFAAIESPSPGFVRTANVHHWAYTETNKQHLWMGDTNLRINALDREQFEQYVKQLAAQKFTHLCGLVLDSAAKGVPSPDQPDPAWFQEIDRRIRFMNQNGLTFDLIMAGGQGQLTKLFSTWQQRERYVRYLVARYSAFDITWQGVEAFEEYKEGRALMKEVGLLLKKLDPYQHPRSAHARVTSAPLLPDGWMDYITYQSSDDAVAAVEHQLYAVPQVAVETTADANAFRRRLWNASMNGQYPSFAGAGGLGGKAFDAWREFFAGTRYWELEPFFDLDGGRAVSLDEVEYVVYLEKPAGPIEVRIVKHNYDVYWLNPLTGESFKQKNYNGEKFVGEPPDRTHDWVLHLSRDGRKEGMLRSYKFESRPVPVQEIELDLKKVPYQIAAPAAEDVSLSKPFQFTAKLTREARATRTMMYLWTGEVVSGEQGYRVLATGTSGSAQVPEVIAKNLTRHYPAVFNVRVTAMNAYGKIYVADRVCRLVE